MCIWTRVDWSSSVQSSPKYFFESKIFFNFTFWNNCTHPNVRRILRNAAPVSVKVKNKQHQLTQQDIQKKLVELASESS